MKISPIAVNHIQIELTSGEVLDINDGTKANLPGDLTVSIMKRTSHETKVISPDITTFAFKARVFERY